MTQRPSEMSVMKLNLNISAWRFYRRFYRPHQRKLAFSIMVSIGQSLIVLPVALLIRHTFDNLIPAGEAASLALVGATIVFLYFLDSGATLWTRYVILRTTKEVIQQFRSELLTKLYAFPRSYYSEQDRSIMHTIIVQDTERLDIMTNALLAQLIPAAFVSFSLCLILVYLNWFLFLVMISIFPLIYMSNKFIGEKTRKEVYAFHRSFEKFSRGILFVLQMMDLTRIQSAEKLEMKTQREKFSHLRQTSRRMAWLKAAYVSAQNASVAVAGVVILIAGGIAVGREYMTIGELLSFYAAVGLLRRHLSTISACIPPIIEGSESLTSLHDLLTREEKRPYAGTTKIPFSGNIRMKGVSFRYKDTPVLKEVSLEIAPGERLAVTGPSGSGKTTLSNLILGFYRPQEGNIFADDQLYGELDLVHLRQQIGVVTQDPIIFSGTIRENISYGYPDAQEKEVMLAAEVSIADEFIKKLPNGYNTHTGESGVLLSGGERQRLAFARAILKKPSLLILDEPINHIDKDIFHRILEGLTAVKIFPSCLILSHDMSISTAVERTYVLKEGHLQQWK